MQYTKLSKLKTLFFIPRRGKGHNEVISSITLVSNNSIEPENFIEFFIKYQKKVLTKDIILEIGSNIITQLALPNLYFNINFSLPVDKLSVLYEESLCFHLNCNYSFNYDVLKFQESNISMKIDCPVRVNYISILEGNLNLEVTQPSPNLYFEDLLDIIQKYGSVIIYPITKASDKQLLLKEIDTGKTIDDYLNFIKVAVIHKGVSEKGKVSVEVSDLYNNYSIEKGVSW